MLPDSRCFFNLHPTNVRSFFLDCTSFETSEGDNNYREFVQLLLEYISLTYPTAEFILIFLSDRGYLWYFMDFADGHAPSMVSLGIETTDKLPTLDLGELISSMQ